MLSELLVLSTSSGHGQRSVHVTMNGVARQHLAVDTNTTSHHQTLRREQKADLVEAGHTLQNFSFFSEGFGSGMGKWDYSNQHQWSETVNNAQACNNGNQQSPIALEDSGVNTTPPASLDALIGRMTGRSSNFEKVEVVNNGHTVKVAAFNSGGANVKLFEFTLPDRNTTAQYNCMQFNFHQGSEHIVNGNTNYLMEMHINCQKVGSSGTDDLAVIALQLQDPAALGSPRNVEAETALLDSLLCYEAVAGEPKVLPPGDNKCEVCGSSSSACTNSTNLTSVYNTEFQGEYFHYQGSLTTPPCTEGVHWYVMTRPAAVSSAFVSAFHSRFSSGNNRTLQARNARWISRNNVTVPTVVIATQTENHEFSTSTATTTAAR